MAKFEYPVPVPLEQRADVTVRFARQIMERIFIDEFLHRPMRLSDMAAVALVCTMPQDVMEGKFARGEISSAMYWLISLRAFLKHQRRNTILNALWPDIPCSVAVVDQKHREMLAGHGNERSAMIKQREKAALAGRMDDMMDWQRVIIAHCALYPCQREDQMEAHKNARIINWGTMKLYKNYLRPFFLQEDTTDRLEEMKRQREWWMEKQAAHRTPRERRNGRI